MIRNHYHFVTAEGKQQETEEALRTWLGRMTQAPGFLGGVLLREFHHHDQNHLGITIDWESHEAFAAFMDGNRAYSPMRAAHHEHDRGHGEAHHHTEELQFEETFHGHYEVAGQFGPSR